jgi:signal transduction histidine kinase
MSDSPLNALARLNEIGAAINQLGTGDATGALDTLRLIVLSAVEVVSGSSAVIFTYDERKGLFDPASRVSAEGLTAPTPLDFPRPDGYGALAVRARRRVLSYEEHLPIHPEKVAVGARVMIGSPLIVGEEVLGVLYVYLHENRALTALELLLLDNFVHHAAMALYIVRQLTVAEARDTRKGKELRRLRRAGMLISSRTNLQDTLESILRMALEVMDAHYGIFRLVDKTGQTLVTRAFIGEGLDHPLIETLPLRRTSIMGTVALDREPLVISDLREAPYCHIYYPLDSKIEMRSELAVPLIGASGRLEGVLNLESPQVNAFSTQDRYILQILATQAVIAIQEARLLDALQDLATLLLTQTRQDVLDQIVQSACKLLNVQVALVWLIQDQHLVLQAASDDHLHGERIEMQSLTGQVITTGQPVTSYDVTQDSRFGLKSFARRYGWGSALIVPIIASDRPTPLGALSIYTTQPDLRHFDEAEWEKKVLALLGHYAALAIQNAARQDELRALQEKRAIAETFAAVGDIASNLLHRLNNKVGTIPVRVEGIQDKCAPLLSENAYLAANLIEIERSAAEAMEIVRENLFHLHPITLAPVSVLAGVREAIRATHPGPETVIELRGLEPLPWIQADQKRLTLLFVNLLENAISAMHGQGRICIVGGADEKWVTVSVSDTGPGIAPALHERIFEFTYSTREHPGKLGFGLWWVKTLVTRFGGTVSVESDGQTGTAFVLKFPLVAEEKMNGPDFRSFKSRIPERLENQTSEVWGNVEGK